MPDNDGLNRQLMEDRRLLGVVTTTDLARTVAERGIRSSTQVA
ncbi:MAG TPA: hypothetical protein VIM36_09190 [Gemmatimonadaceae bacterium]